MFTCPSVTKKVGEKEVELRLDFNAAALVESVTGKNLLDGKVLADLSVTMMTVIYWACAVQMNPKLTLVDVRKSSFKDAADMVDAVRAAWRAANDLPEEDAHPTNGSKP